MPSLTRLLQELPNGACLLFTALAIGLLLTKQLGLISPYFDVLNMVWPISVFGAGSCLAILLVLRAPRLELIRLAGVAVSAITVLLSLPYAQFRPVPQSLPSRAETGQALRMATQNLWYLNPTPDQAYAYLVDADLDVIVFQEVWGRPGRQLKHLTESHPYQIQCPRSLFLASRRPILQQECGQRSGLAYGWMKLEHQGRDVVILGVHLPHPTDPDRYAGYVSDIIALTQRLEETPLILVGDFNMAEQGYQMLRLSRALTPMHRVSRGLRTWPSDRISPFAFLGIDHVWLDEDLCLQALARGPHLGSDHRAVLTSVDFCQPQ